ncbi:MAG: hypothetical protein GY851_10215 [bacterium]|nr:hypothetical protein [bacterium]
MRGIRCSGVWLALAVGAMVWFGGHAADAASKDAIPLPSELPWTLRDCYTFAANGATLEYAVDTGEWRIGVDDVGMVLPRVGSAVLLADGTAIDSIVLPAGTSDRDQVTTELGYGSEYHTKLAAPGPLAIRHSITVLQDYPFYMIRFEVRNTSDKPVSVASLTPVVTGPAGVNRLSDQTELAARPMNLVANHPLIDLDAPASAAVLRDPSHKLAVGIATFPMTKASTGIRVRPHQGTWHLEISSTYDPPVEIAPGDTLEADPVLICCTMLDTAEADTYLAWAHKRRATRALTHGCPESWVTVPDTGSAKDLAEATQAWWTAGIRCALVPTGWESVPGSLKGDDHLYPKDMSKLATIIDRSGMAPGIAVNPLPALDTDAAWLVEGTDGQRWVNPADPDGYRHALGQMRQVVEWGYRFFVVTPTGVPDDVLKACGLTRAEMTNLAFRVVEEAAEGLPVLPASAAVLGADPDSWLRAAGATHHFRERDIFPGPVRFDATGVDTLSHETIAAMGMFRGPIEMVGIPTEAVIRRVARICSQPRPKSSPMDGDAAAPRLWQVETPDAKAQPYARVFMFPKAGEWQLDTAMAPNAGRTAWVQTSDSITEVTGSTVPACDTFAICTVGSDPGRPHVVANPGLFGGAVQSVTWSSAEATLSGDVDVSNSGVVYVAVPKSWEFRWGKVGRAAWRPERNGKLLAFRLDDAKTGPFELKFRRNK